MQGHEPLSDAGLLFGSIFVAVSIVGIGILGGQQGPEQVARTSPVAMTAAAAASITPDQRAYCTLGAQTKGNALENNCMPGCIYDVQESGSHPIITVIGGPNPVPKKNASGGYDHVKMCTGGDCGAYALPPGSVYYNTIPYGPAAGGSGAPSLYGPISCNSKSGPPPSIEAAISQSQYGSTIGSYLQGSTGTFAPATGNTPANPVSGQPNHNECIGCTKQTLPGSVNSTQPVVDYTKGTWYDPVTKTMTYWNPQQTDVMTNESALTSGGGGSGGVAGGSGYYGGSNGQPPPIPAPKPPYIPPPIDYGAFSPDYTPPGPPSPPNNSTQNTEGMNFGGTAANETTVTAPTVGAPAAVAPAPPSAVTWTKSTDGTYWTSNTGIVTMTDPGNTARGTVSPGDSCGFFCKVGQALYPSANATELQPPANANPPAESPTVAATTLQQLPGGLQAQPVTKEYPNALFPGQVIPNASTVVVQPSANTWTQKNNTLEFGYPILGPQ